MIRNFIAVMKDSFREAVDGFIIYVMLALAALTILFAASLTFDPQPADEAFPAMVKPFLIAFRDKGNDTEMIGIRDLDPNAPAPRPSPLPLNYTATGVERKEGTSRIAGKYDFQLTVGLSPQLLSDDPKVNIDPIDASEIFRIVVFCWKQVKYPEAKILVLPAGARRPEDPEQMELVPEGADADAALAERRKANPQWTMRGVPAPFLTAAYKAKYKSLVRLLERQDEIGKIAFDLLKKELAKSDPKFGGELTRDDLTRRINDEVKRLQGELDTTLSGVSKEDTEAFISNQFQVHGGLKEVTAERVSSPMDSTVTFRIKATVRGGEPGWPHTSKLFFGAVEIVNNQPLGLVQYFIQDKVINVVGASITLLVSVILTGFFIPNMLRKGSLDLIMAKPMARWELLLYKYIGGLCFVFVVTSITVGGVWLVMSLQSGNWNPTFLLSIPLLTFTFAVLYAVSTFVAVLTRSAIAAILITSIFMALIGTVGFLKTINDALRTAAVRDEDKKNVYFTVVDGLNAGLPRYNDLLKINSKAMADGYYPPSLVKISQTNDTPSWVVAVGISLGYIVGLLALAYLRFATRDP